MMGKPAEKSSIVAGSDTNLKVQQQPQQGMLVRKGKRGDMWNKYSRVLHTQRGGSHSLEVANCREKAFFAIMAILMKTLFSALIPDVQISSPQE